MKAWYFSKEDKRLRYGDGRIIKAGRTHKVKGGVELCGYGLHASRSILGALDHAPGPVIWRVELGGETLKDSVKMCASERTYLWGYDASDVLQQEGIDVEIVDLLTLEPLDIELILESVKKTNRVVIAHEATKNTGFGAEISAQISEEVFEFLDAETSELLSWLI